ncbi:MAG: c-type cytochrome [Rhizobiaceae bacterium]
MRRLTKSILLVSLLSAAGVALSSCKDEGKKTAPFQTASAREGVTVIKEAGCGSCHTIPGIENADGLVGPPLDHMGHRIFIAGVLRNTPDNMVAWLRDPQRIVPGNAMPVMGLSEKQAQAVTDYLYSLH